VKFTAETEELFNHDLEIFLQTDAVLCSPDAAAEESKEILLAKEHGIPIVTNSGNHTDGETEVPNSTGKPVLSQYVLHLKAKAEKARSHAIDIFKEAVINSPDKVTPELDAAIKEYHKLVDIAYGMQTAELLADCLGLESNLTPSGAFVGVWYEKTLRKPAFTLSVFAANESGGIEDIVLARGRIPGNHRKHWYFPTNCTFTMCHAPAYVRLKHEKAWYGKDRLIDVAERKALFAADIVAANAVVALCGKHRKKAVETETPASPEE
jgi:hypothetical protein